MISSQAELLTGKAVPDLESGYEVIKLLHSYGTSRIVLTMGAQGVLFTDFHTSGDLLIKHIPAKNVEVVDTTVSSGFCHVLI